MAKRTRVPFEERFWQSIERQSDGCWRWTGCIDKRSGYGKAYWNGRNYQAHRAVYELLVGPIPDGLTLDHLCHGRDCHGGVTCPHRACVNPAHLKPATSVENTRRSQLGLLVRYRTHCHKGHPYTPENTYVKPNGTRNCKVCSRAYVQAYRQRKRAVAEQP